MIWWGYYHKACSNLSFNIISHFPSIITAPHLVQTLQFVFLTSHNLHPLPQPPQLHSSFAPQCKMDSIINRYCLCSKQTWNVNHQPIIFQRGFKLCSILNSFWLWVKPTNHLPTSCGYCALKYTSIP